MWIGAFRKSREGLCGLVERVKNGRFVDCEVICWCSSPAPCCSYRTCRPARSGGWLLATGVAGWVLLNAIVAAGLRGPTRQPTSWRATRVVTVQVAALPIVAAGGLLIADRDSALYWLVAGTLLCLLAATGNAWVLLVEIVRDERYLPVESEPR